MNGGSDSAFPITALEGILSRDDDPYLWRAALSVVTDDFLQRYNRGSKNKNWGIVVGACSHWVRPHQTRWTKAGGFAYPAGYKSFKPELDWSVILLFHDQKWIPVVTLPGKRLALLDVVIPSRTARHKQAVIYSRWRASGELVFYGFRKLDGKWSCVAASDEDQTGRILGNP